MITGGIGSVLGVLKIGKDFFEFTPTRSIIFGASFLAGLFVIRFVLIFCHLALKYFHEVYKNSSYGEAIILLKDSFAEMHAYRKKPNPKDEDFMNVMISLCENLKEVFDKITTYECSVSIKVPLSDPKVDEKTVVMNLIRDSKHKSRDTETYIKAKHTLIGNTAFNNSFNKVVKGKTLKHYMNNSINKTPDYENTSKDVYENGALPYSSELVYPIVPVLSRDGTVQDCHGFICVDCKEEHAFDGKYDVAILEGVADGIYDLMSERNQAKNKQHA